MKRYTLRDLKNFVKVGAAIDCNSCSPENLPFGAVQIGYSSGIYGINGALFEDCAGNWYAITARTPNLFRMT